jgi:hypothetical protein
MIDLDAFEERAAIMEFCGGLSRFQAETLAAKAQGYNRHEVLNEIRQRNLAAGRDHGLEVAGQSRADNVPRVQRRAEEENRPMLERNEKG